jgi:hypothetical protein
LDLKARKSLIVGLFFVGAISMVGASAMAQEERTPSSAKGFQAGFLSCNVASGWGFILGSSRALKCVWEPQKGVQWNYTGRILNIGADIGYSHASVLLWLVSTATRDFGAKGLVGTFAGVGASAAVGGGVGANLLVGGFQNSVTLQPLSVSGEIGLNAAAGIRSMTLTEVKGEAKGPEAAPQ